MSIEGILLTASLFFLFLFAMCSCNCEDCKKQCEEELR